MTGNEAELIERLIVEAAKRGAVDRQLGRAVKAAEDAAAIMAADKIVIRKLTEQVEWLNERREEAERPLAEFYRAAQSLMREIGDPSRYLRKERIDAAVATLRRTSAAASGYCSEVPF